MSLVFTENDSKYEEIVAWFKYHHKSAPWDELVEKYSSICKARLNFFSKNNFDKIIESWEVLKHPQANKLVRNMF